MHLDDGTSAPTAAHNPDRPKRYFIMKCAHAEDLEFSRSHGVWAPQVHYERTLADAFKVRSVFLFPLLPPAVLTRRVHSRRSSCSSSA